MDDRSQFNDTGFETMNARLQLMSIRRRLQFLMAVTVAAQSLAAIAVTPMVSYGVDHALALRSDGTVVAWGSDQFGKLGTGRPLFSVSPEMVPGLNGVRAVAAGTYHSLAIARDNTVWTWGSNSAGQLGDGTTTDRSSPVQVSGISLAIQVCGASGGLGEFSMVLKQDGTIWSFGRNDNGQLGIGSLGGNTPTPVQVVGLSSAKAIACGDHHAAALLSDGSVWTWGSNGSGELGDGSTPSGNATASRTQPAPVPGFGGAVAIASANTFTVALKQDGTVWSWGNGSSTPALMPGISSATVISAGAFGTVAAIKSDGTTWWLGAPGSALAMQNPVGTLLGVAAGSHTLLLKSDHTLLARGQNDNGELGDGTTTYQANPVPVAGLSNVAAIAAGFSHSLALDADGNVWAWGSDSAGQLGQGTSYGSTIPVSVSGLSNIVQVSAGQEHSLALDQGGNIWAWGSNVSGQLGDGSNTNRSAPVRLTSVSGFQSVSAGYEHSLAIRRDGTLWAWGAGFAGQLGDGTGNSTISPSPVPGFANALAISAGGDYSLAVKNDGTVWSWGRNDFGVLGLGTTTPFTGSVGTQPPNSVPTQIPGLSNVVAVAAVGFSNSYAVRSDGSVMAWGVNDQAQIGNGSQISRQSPVPVVGSNGLPVSGVVEVAGGGFHALARKTDGSVLGWGTPRFSSGDLGFAANVSQLTALPIPNVSAIQHVSAGMDTSALVRSDGLVMSGGSNNAGQLGDGTFAQHPSFVLVVDTSAQGFLNLNVGGSATISADLSVPFFVVASGGVTSTSATVNTTTRFNAADIGKTGGVFITAKVPRGAFGIPGTASNVAAVDRTAIEFRVPSDASAAPPDPGTYQMIQLTSSGWQPVVNGQLLSYAEGVLGGLLAAQSILNNVNTTTMPGAQFCLGYGTSATEMTAAGRMRTVATIPNTSTASTTTASCIVSSASVIPQSGIWWNPAEGGRGYTLEYNGTNLFMATYLYDASGRSTWYGAGPAPMSGTTFSAPLTSYSGGQTLTGAFKPATQGASPGSISITFTDATHGSMTWPGGTIPIQRYEFVTNGLSSPPTSTQPQTGWWWNPSEGGRGFSVEVQANNAFIASYMYDGSGNPVWYASGPAALTNNNIYQGNWTSYMGGQTLTGTYHPATGTSNAGNLTVQFASPTSGTMTLPDGRQIPIQRFSF